MKSIRDSLKEKRKENSLRLHAYLDGQHSLYDEQHDILEKAAEHLAQNNMGYFTIATGYGKTHMGAALTKAIKRRTLVLVPSKELAAQTFKVYTQSFGFDPKTTAIYHSDVSQKERDKASSNDTQVLITTYASFINLVKQDIITPDARKKGYFDLIQLDEVDLTRGAVINHVLQRFQDRSTIIGWTGTDIFRDGYRVSKLFRDQEPIGRRITPKEAIEEGRLAPVQAWSVKADTDLPEYERLHSLRDKTHKEAQTIWSMSQKATKAAGIYRYGQDVQGKPLWNRPAMLSTRTVDEAVFTAKVFNTLYGNGKDIAAAVSGDTPPNELKKILRDHEEGKLKVICFANLLGRGNDFPYLEIMFQMYDSTSPAKIAQLGGRVLRTTPDKPDKIAQYISIVDKNTPPNAVRFADIITGTYIPPVPEKPFSISTHFGSKKNTSSHPRSQKDDDEHGVDSLFSVLESDDIKELVEHDGLTDEKQIRDSLIIKTPGHAPAFLTSNEKQIRDSSIIKTFMRPGHAPAFLTSKEMAARIRQDTFVDDLTMRENFESIKYCYENLLKQPETDRSDVVNTGDIALPIDAIRIDEKGAIRISEHCSNLFYNALCLYSSNEEHSSEWLDTMEVRSWLRDILHLGEREGGWDEEPLKPDELCMSRDVIPALKLVREAYLNPARPYGEDELNICGVSVPTNQIRQFSTKGKLGPPKFHRSLIGALKEVVHSYHQDRMNTDGQWVSALQSNRGGITRGR